MSLLHPVLLGLLGLVAVPVILHFLMKQKPKKLLFPALRLIEMRRKTNVRRLRLRHVWLLLLRIAIIALLVIAIARPLVPAANYGLSTSELLTLLAVIVLRLVWVFPVRYLLLRPGRDHDRQAPWNYTFILGWAGMRGVVTLGAAFVITEIGRAQV